MKLKDELWIIWMIELGAICLLGPKGSILVHPDSALWVYLGLHFCGAINDCFQINTLQGTKLKYVPAQLNTFVNFILKFASDVI